MSDDDNVRMSKEQLETLKAIETEQEKERQHVIQTYIDDHPFQFYNIYGFTEPTLNAEGKPYTVVAQRISVGESSGLQFLDANATQQGIEWRTSFIVSPGAYTAVMCMGPAPKLKGKAN